MYDHESILKFLLDNGAMVDAVDNAGKTALMWGKKMCATFLCVQIYSFSFQIKAVDSGKANNARLLVERGANITLKDNQSKTAFDLGT